VEKYNNVLTLFYPNRVLGLTPEQKNILENYSRRKKLQKTKFFKKKLSNNNQQNAT